MRPGSFSLSLKLAVLSFAFLLVCGCDDGGGKSEAEDVVECGAEKPHEFEGSCVQCLEDGHCPAAQTCNLKTGNCACPGAQPHFDGEACRACLKDSHCPDGSACDLATFACAELLCPEESPYLYGGACVECTGDDHCPGELACRPANHTCGCSDPALKVLDNACVECVKSTDCPMGKYCKDNVCVGEGQTTSCPPETPYNFQGNCYECLEDGHCAAGESCHATKLYCIPPPLVCEGETPYEYLGQCVQCLENAHCPEGKICNKTEKLCEDTPVSGGECNYAGNGMTIGSLIGNFGAVGCDGEVINLHDYCGKAKAVWLINVAGWCGGCDQYAPQANQIWQQYKDQGLQLIFVLGENPQSGAPTPAYCQQWAQSHQVTAPIMLDAHWAGIDSKIAASGYDLPWDYLLDGDDMEYVWESVNWSQDALLGNIQILLND
jgi:Cys-rich repeat protein